MSLRRRFGSSYQESSFSSLTYRLIWPVIGQRRVVQPITHTLRPPPAPYTRCAIYVRQAHYAFALCGWNISLLLPLKYNFKYIRDNKLRRRLTLLIRTNPRRLFFLKVGASQVSTTLIFGCLEAESSRT